MKPLFRIIEFVSSAWYKRASRRRAAVCPELAAWARAVAGTDDAVTPIHQGIWKQTVRVRTADGGAIAQWLPSRAEFRACVALGNHLRSGGVPVPHLLAADYAHSFLLLEDLGDKTLSSLEESLPEDTPLRAAIALADFHERGTRGFKPEYAWRRNGRFSLSCWILECATRLYPWMAANAGGIPKRRFPAIHREMGAYAATLRWRESAQGLLHTDWHYENLMPAPKGLSVIDWQGAAWGPRSLDLARLTMTNTETVWQQRDAIIAAYLEESRSGSPEPFLRQLELMETGWMMRLFPLFAGKEKTGNKKIPLVAEKLTAIAERESMRNFPLLADLFQRAAAMMTQHGLSE